MKFLSDIRVLLLSIWLGAAVFFIGVAQSAFAVVPQRELAGAVVNRTLTILNIAGIAIFVLLLLLSFVGGGINKVLLWIERLLLLTVVAACAVGQFVFGFWLAMKRAEIGRPIDEVAAEDPLRIQFQQLHTYSEWTLLIGMAAALLAFFLIANRKPAVAVKSVSSDPYSFEKEFKV
jgi:hypothetical protein